MTHSNGRVAEGEPEAPVVHLPSEARARTEEGEAETPLVSPSAPADTHDRSWVQAECIRCRHSLGWHYLVLPGVRRCQRCEDVCEVPQSG